MNQRIRELVKQAGGEFWQRLENDTVNPEAFVTFDPPESLAKFAELIVKECVQTVQDRGGMCGALAANWIEEHFRS